MDHGEPLPVLAAEAGISLRTAYKGLARFRSVDPQLLQQAVDLRPKRCTLRRFANAVGAPLSTVGRPMKALGLGRLRNLVPKAPVQRYQWKKPGDMIHVDTTPKASPQE
jgi:hypothetical protein